MSKKQGYLNVFSSAFIFGVTPIFTVITYNYGNSGLNMAFLRNLVCLPIFLLFIFKSKKSLKIDFIQLRHLLIVSFLGSSASTIFLYLSYQYISSGLATILHFTYPVFTLILVRLIYKSSITKNKIISVFLSAIGLICFVDSLTSVTLGYFLALFSGISYAFYIVWIQKSKLILLNPFILSFYLSILSCVYLIAINFFKPFITFQLDFSIWIVIILISLSTSFVATILFQRGLKIIDGTSASILSLLEPILSFFLSIVFQNEVLTFAKIIGFTLIIMSILIISLNNFENN